MQKISVTYVITVVDLGSDEFGNMADEDTYFVITGLPAEHVSEFWKEITSIPDCSQRSVKKGVRDDGRLRIDWNDLCDYADFLQTKKKILETIKRLVPNAKIRYRQINSGLSVANEMDDLRETFKDCALTEDEAEALGFGPGPHFPEPEY